MSKALRWTSADLERLPDDGKRYEIVDGDLLVSKQPSLEHQAVCFQAASLLQTWSLRTNLGQAFMAPGIIFADNDDVVPDVVWISQERLRLGRRPDGHLHLAPELVVEVLSPGAQNERRDREIKLQLYSRRGVSEYWIVDWRARTVEVYRRGAAALERVAILSGQARLETPLLPGFSCAADEIFVGLAPLEG